ncbi:putative nepenthesin [Helianthus annuus]|nr:putative nepenthesin [Helianthus annuus]
MNTLILLTLFLTISGSLSKPSHHDHGGFTIDLIHRDSPLSPLYNPTYSLTDRLHNAFRRSMSRAFRLSKTSVFASKMEADIFGIPGEYIMNIQIGTPPVQVLGIADTGSDLTWAQCEPCKNCYKQVGPPLLVPASSSTYHAQSCQSKACEALEDNNLSCDSQNICQYKMSYGDRSYSTGDLAMDTFWFGQTSFKHVVFGCGHDNNATFNENISGIIGLGGGPLSIINQLNPVIQGKFSYCLISQFNDTTSNQTSKIHFGDGVDISGPSVVSTPLVKKAPSTYYYVTLESVSIGIRDLSYKQSISKSGVNEEGNIIVDSGTTLTYLPSEFYSYLSSGLANAIDGVTTKDPNGILELCYKDLYLSRVPTVTFRFTGADVVIPTVNMFLEVEEGVSCLTIVPSDDLAIFGNLLQVNFMVGFDLVNQKVSFMPTDCTKCTSL